MRILSTILFAFIFTGLHCSAQSRINGHVTDSSGTPVEFANIVASTTDAPKTPIAVTLTDEKGYYDFYVNSHSDSLLLTISGMDIARQSIVVPNRTEVHDLTAMRKAVELKEMTIAAKKIYSSGDTVNYNVAAYLSHNDRVLADVLRKMPGISVAESGQISYQGKPVKNFYIEGLDLMKGHYGIATNNIDPNNIATVQVLENHQDIKALKGLRPEEQASINIRLKDGVKGVFNIIANIGGGYDGDAVWNNSAIATYFKRNSQFLVTYKGNNSGEDLSQELSSFDNDYARTSDLTGIAMPSAPGIDKKFYYLNRSHSATYNNAYRIGTSGELGINAAILNDRDSRRANTSTANTLPDGLQNIVDEHMSGLSKTNKAYGDITYMLNSDHTYLKEQLKFDWSATDAESSITTDGNNIEQFGSNSLYRLSNKFHLTKRNNDNRGYEIYSVINLEKHPHSITVSPNLFSNLITGNYLHQNVDFRNFSTENRFGFLSTWKLCNLTINPGAFINFNRNSLTSSLADSYNNLRLDNFSAGLNTEMALLTRKFDFSLYLPVGYKLFNLNNLLNNVGSEKNRVLVEPRLELTYKFNSSHRLSLKSALSYTTPTILNLYSNFILTSYRCLSSYNETGLFEGSNLTNTLSYNFKNILAMTFAGIDLMWNRQKPDILYGSYYDGLVERIISRSSNETADMLSATVRGSKGFDFIRLKVGLAASCDYYSSPLLVQDAVTRYYGKSYQIDGDISFVPAKWVAMAYNCKYFQSSSRQKGFANMPWLKTFSQEVSADLNLPAGISIRTSLYHYYNSFNDGDKSFALLNAEARYTVNRITFTFSCDNLLNRKNYIYSSLSALTETRAAYTIRQRTVMLKIRLRIL